MNENYGPFPTNDDIKAKDSRWELRFSSGRTCLAQFSGLDPALISGVTPESCCYIASDVWLSTATAGLWSRSDTPEHTQEVATAAEMRPQAAFKICQVGDTSSIEARPAEHTERQCFERSHGIGKPVRHTTTGKLGFIVSGEFAQMPTNKCVSADGTRFLVCSMLKSIPDATLTHKVLWTDTPLPFSETTTYTAAELEFLDYPAWTSLVDPAQYLADLTAKQS